jgi:hypothetical protein
MKVEVRVGDREGTLWAGPQSRERRLVHDHVEGSWRHLDPCQFESFLHCRVPRLWLATKPGQAQPAERRRGRI